MPIFLFANNLFNKNNIQHNKKYVIINLYNKEGALWKK